MKINQTLLISILVVLGLVFLFTIFYFIGANTSNTSNTSMKKLEYSNATYGLKFNYPEDWSADSKNDDSTVMYLTSDKKANIRFALNKATSIEPGDVLNQSLDLFVQDFPKEVKDFKLLSREESTLADAKSVKVVYTADYPGLGLKKQLQIRSIKKVGENYIQIIITFTGDEASFDKYINDANEIVNSVKIS
jgi:hypothetical protein